MNTTDTPGMAESGRIESWRDFHARVEAAMAMLAAEPADLLLVDPDFVHWPLGQRSVMEGFHQWAISPSRRQLTLLAADFGELPRCHPRWMAWYQRWSHRVRCLQPPPELAGDLKATLILGNTLALRVIEPRLGEGLWTRDSARIAIWRNEVDVILQRSQEALPPTTLGL